jgi:hypothetical protein
MTLVMSMVNSSSVWLMLQPRTSLIACRMSPPIAITRSASVMGLLRPPS